jgi:hypothetical protein
MSIDSIQTSLPAASRQHSKGHDFRVAAMFLIVALALVLGSAMFGTLDTETAIKALGHPPYP